MDRDMYAYTTSDPVRDVDFARPDDMEELFCWRNHSNLHAWMERLYRSKGGEDPRFNLSPVCLDSADIDALEGAVAEDRLGYDDACLAGGSTPEDKKDDIEFIHRARDALARGRRLFYIASW